MCGPDSEPTTDGTQPGSQGTCLPSDLSGPQRSPPGLNSRCKDPDNITFGAEQEFSFSELQNPVLEWLIEDLAIRKIRVQHDNGWDHIVLSLDAPLSYALRAKIDQTLDFAERCGALDLDTRQGLDSGAFRMILALVHSVSLDAEVSYDGRLTEHGDVEMRNLSGIGIRARFFTYTPSGGEIRHDAKASIDGRLGKIPIPKLAHAIPAVFAEAVIESIRSIERIRESARSVN